MVSMHSMSCVACSAWYGEERKYEKKEERRKVRYGVYPVIYLLPPTFCGSFVNEVLLSRFYTSFELTAISLVGCRFFGQTALTIH